MILAPIRLRDHIPIERREELAPDLRALVEAAEWTLDVSAVVGRTEGLVHFDCSTVPNYAALELQRRASKLSAGLTG